MRADSTKPSEDEGVSPSALADQPRESDPHRTPDIVNGPVRGQRIPPPDRQRPQLPPRTEVQPQRGWRNTFSSLKSRDYLVLWLGMMAMMGGMQMQMLARGYLVYDLTGSASLLGIVSAGSAIPMLVLALFGGAIADTFDRKRLIQIGQVIVGLLALVIGLAIFTDWIRWYHLLISSLIQGAIWSFMMPARQAIIPQVVGPEKIGNAMALNAAGMSAMTLMAPAIAGGLYAFAGPANVYFVITGLSVVAMLMTSLITRTDVSAPSRKRAMLSDIAAGLSYIKGNQMVLVLLVMGLATTLLASPFRMLLPVFVVDVYGRGPDSMGLLVAIMGGGSLVGSLVIAALGNWRRGMLLIVGSFASGIALLLIAAFPFYYAAAVIMLLVGLGDSGRRTINMGLIMEVVEDQYRGRVMSVFMMNFGLMPLGMLPAGLAVDYFGGPTAIAILGGLLLTVSAAVVLTQKQLRSFQ